MTRVHVRRAVPVPATDALAVLDTRPARWLRPFLLVAAATPPAAAPSDPTRLWYRLGPMRREHDAAAASLVWWPHAGSRMFRRFRGTLAVLDAAGEAVLDLEGEFVDGDDAVNPAVLEALLDALASALSAARRS